MVSPATTTVPLRAPPPFASIVSVSDPLPVPLAADVTWIHGAWLAAVHAQFPVASIVMLTAPPPAPTPGARGATVNRHSAASCVIVAFESFTSMVACRWAGSRFAATR